MDEIEGTKETIVISRLSKQQRTCLQLVAEGHTSKEIGRSLNLSPSTVDNHIRAAIMQLGVHDRATAARLLQSANIVQPTILAEPPLSGPTKQSLFSLPPLGGEPNELSARRRIYHVVQIALLGIMGMAAAVVTIAGLVNLFGR